jgi:hypothetical protein
MKHFALLFVLVALAACSDRSTGTYDDPTVEQQQYFPLSIGHTVDYQIDSVVFNEVSGIGLVRDSSTTLVREVVADTLRDPSGNLQWKIERYERKTASEPWEIADIWSAEINDKQAVRTEENLRFLRLVFPMDRRSEWNGNLWIDPFRSIIVAGQNIRPFTNWSYEVDSIGIARNIGNFSFDDALIVTEVDETNIIERRLSRSIYAKGVGLVFREQFIADSQYCNETPPPTDCVTKPWVEKAERGYYIRQTVIGF